MHKLKWSKFCQNGLFCYLPWSECRVTMTWVRLKDNSTIFMENWKGLASLAKIRLGQRVGEQKHLFSVHKALICYCRSPIKNIFRYTSISIGIIWSTYLFPNEIFALRSLLPDGEFLLSWSYRGISSCSIMKNSNTFSEIFHKNVHSHHHDDFVSHPWDILSDLKENLWKKKN